MGVVISFAGKVISLDTSDTVILSKVCARSSLSRTLQLSLDWRLQGYKVYACVCVRVRVCCVNVVFVCGVSGMCLCASECM